MNSEQHHNKVFDLEDRTYTFANDVRELIRALPASPFQTNDKRQLIRSSGSVAADYIEANDALGLKDFRMRLKIARKEAKESVLWLKLIKNGQTEEFGRVIEGSIQEGIQLVRIFSAIIAKFK